MYGKKIALPVVVGLVLSAAIAIPNGNPSSSELETPSRDMNLGTTLYVGGSGPNNYTKIQDAVDNASDGDTVFVYDDSSPYYENIEIHKSINLIGENRNNTIIDGGEHGNVVNVTADWVNISMFAIQNSGIPHNGGSGIILYYSNNGNIKDNIIQNNWYGIRLSFSGNNIISRNIILSNSNGISLWYSNSNNILDNNINGNSNDGICLLSSSNNNILDNNFRMNLWGIYIHNSNNNSISDNYISAIQESPKTPLITPSNCLYKSKLELLSSFSKTNKPDSWLYRGVELCSSSNNNISGNALFKVGLIIHNSYQNIVSKNTVNDKPLVYLEEELDIVVNDAGQVILIECNNITVQNQNLSETSIGIELWNTNNSLISGNIVSNNNYGIYLHSSKYNSILDNNINSNYLEGISLRYSENNNISDNNIKRCFEGIYLCCSSKNSISSNNITNCPFGVHLLTCNNNSISNNDVKKNWAGICFDSSSNNTVFSNNILSNENGILLRSSHFNIIQHNNFITNHRHAIFVLYKLRFYFSNCWNRNYWGRPRILPKPILGYLGPFLPCLLNFDWHPAIEPYG